MSGWGLTLFLQRGMVAWIRAWAAVPSKSIRCSGGTIQNDSLPKPLTSFPPELCAQVAAILASAFLESRQEVLV
jgi:hypothetical protein